MDKNTVALAISGLSLAIAFVSLSWTIAWSIWLYRRSNRPSLRVVSEFGFLQVSGLALDVITTSVTNVGQVPVTIRGIALRVKNDRKRQQLIPYEWLHASLPVKLETGEHWDAPMIQRENFVKHLQESFSEEASGSPRSWKLLTFCRDAADHHHVSKRTITIRERAE